VSRARRNCVAVDGVLLLDKPAGLTSNAALQACKRALNACKAGHTGSLDPMATGLLPLCFGEATKVTQFLLDADKRYRAVFRLGQETTTFDNEGEVVAQAPVTATAREVERALKRFEGRIEQIPPMYSAIKRAGQPLYKLARAGVEVPREPRAVEIYAIRMLALAGEHLELEVACSKGTYVRSLAHDLGRVLGCGAHVATLRRMGVGNLQVDDAITLDQFERLDEAGRRAALKGADVMVGDLPDVQLTALAAHYLRQGQAVSVRHQLAPGWVRLYEEGHRFLGMGQVLDDGRVAPRRLLGLASRG
jgi:tRNA pseudouridine55 synthase